MSLDADDREVRDDVGLAPEEPNGKANETARDDNAQRTAAPGSTGHDAAPELQDRTIIMLLQGVDDEPDDQLTRSVVYDIINQLGGICPGSGKQNRVDIWLESPGGGAHAAFKLMVYLRSRFRIVNVVIPDYAKSAATLLTLGADAIFMAPCAELGPLDMQQSREGETRSRSALDTANSVENLFHRAVANAIIGGGNVLQQTRLTRETTLKIVLDFSAAFYHPLVRQLDPLAIYSASSGLRVTLDYGVRLLEARGISRDRAREQIEALVSGYPTHGFIIERSEAERSFKLPVRHMEDYDLREDICALYGAQQQAQTNIVKVTTLFELMKEKEEHGGDKAGDEPATEGDVD